MDTNVSLKHAVILRQSNSNHGVPGYVFVKNEETGQMDYFSRSLELPWISNKPRISCIPTGTYECEFTYSPKYRRKLYLVKNVAGRSGIRLHSGSFAGRVDLGYRCHLLGCISLGKGFYGGPGTNSQLLLHTSRVTMSRFEKWAGGEKLLLTIAGELKCLESQQQQ